MDFTIHFQPNKVHRIEKKKEALRAAGVTVSDFPADVGKTVKEVLQQKGLL